MRAVAILLCLMTGFCPLAGAQAMHTYRRENSSLFGTVHLNADQKAKIDRLTATYGLKIAKLLKDEKYDDADLVNQTYSKGILKVLTPWQRDRYLEAVYRQMLDFHKSHPSVAFADIFIEGGAYAKKPAH